MLNIEICLDNQEDIEMEAGTYKLNSSIGPDVLICEYENDCNSIYSGYLTLSNNNEINLFKYKTSNTINYKETYSEEIMPNVKYKNHWRSVIGDESEKYEILRVLSRISSLKKSSIELFGLNRCILIHGKPGIGKSTFSKALIQKLAIRENKKIILRTVNCSSLFSRFYGESMKILEESININNSDHINVILFDEADSILLDRKLILERNEPGDSLRMVNTLLCALDRKENLFIFTSNFKKELDPAFLSRCDIFYEMKKLTVEQTYNLIKSVIEQLFRVEFDIQVRFLDFSNIKICGEECDRDSSAVYELAIDFSEMSPREIKKRIAILSTSKLTNVSDLLLKLKHLN